MITKAIVIICVVIYLIINFVDKDPDKRALAIKYGALYPPVITFNKEYWRLLTANFVHIDLFHIGFNVICIYQIGEFFEVYLGMVPYLFLVVVSGLTSSAVTYYLSFKDHQKENIVTLGASGIFFGYLGAMIALGVILQGYYMDFLLDNMLIIVLNIGFTFMNRNISKTGHFGGLAGGFIAMALLIVTGICGY